jgi:hypothetical protein
MVPPIEKQLTEVLNHYKEAFSSKTYDESDPDTDILMDVFCITPEIKLENMQYWGRELGKCWEKIVQITLKTYCIGYGGHYTLDRDEFCDCIVNKHAIDAKYRVGSGDSGTLKKFKEYGKKLREDGYEPVMLFLREDNLSAAITAAKSGGWMVFIGDDSFNFIKKLSGFDLKKWLISCKGKFDVGRK